MSGPARTNCATRRADIVLIPYRRANVELVGGDFLGIALWCGLGLGSGNGSRRSGEIPIGKGDNVAVLEQSLCQPPRKQAVGQHAQARHLLVTYVSPLEAQINSTSFVICSFRSYRSSLAGRFSNSCATLTLSTNLGFFASGST
jgi:hypothetical protein